MTPIAVITIQIRIHPLIALLRWVSRCFPIVKAGLLAAWISSPSSLLGLRVSFGRRIRCGLAERVVHRPSRSFAIRRCSSSKYSRDSRSCLSRQFSPICTFPRFFSAILRLVRYLHRHRYATVPFACGASLPPSRPRPDHRPVSQSIVFLRFDYPCFPGSLGSHTLCKPQSSSSQLLAAHPEGLTAACIPTGEACFRARHCERHSTLRAAAPAIDCARRSDFPPISRADQVILLVVLRIAVRIAVLGQLFLLQSVSEVRRRTDRLRPAFHADSLVHVLLRDLGLFLL
jgi:hypothetical protein